MRKPSLAGSASFRFQDRFIHESVTANRDALYRARILVFTLLAAIPALISVTGLLVLWAPPDFLGFLLPINIFCIATSLLILHFLQRYGSLNVCSALTVIMGILAIGFIVAFTGGANLSPARQLLFMPCLMSFLFGGIRMGIATLSICVALLAGMHTVQLAGFEFPLFLDASFRTAGHVVVLLFNFSFVSILAFSYESTSIILKKERDQEHQKFLDLAQKDPLTGVANRRIFDEELDSRIKLYSRMPTNPCFVLCYLDLDKFKPINDNYGHDVGDEVLRVTSNRLLSALRGADFLGRHGGDEFFLLFDGVQSEEAVGALGIRLLQLIREPISTRSGMLTIDASLGFAKYPEHGHDAKGLRNATDSAMYEAKRSHCGFHIYR